MGHRVHLLIQEIHLQIGDRNTDDATGHEVSSSDPPVSHMHCGFSNAVHVHQLRALIPMPIKPGPERLHVKRFAAKDDQAKREGPHLTRLFRPNQLSKRRRRLVQHRHLFPLQQLIKGFRGATHRKWHNDQPPTVKERSP
jgi:hypothetical protein